MPKERCCSFDINQPSVKHSGVRDRECPRAPVSSAYAFSCLTEPAPFARPSIMHGTFLPGGARDDRFRRELGDLCKKASATSPAVSRLSTPQARSILAWQGCLLYRPETIPARAVWRQSAGGNRLSAQPGSRFIPPVFVPSRRHNRSGYYTEDSPCSRNQADATGGSRIGVLAGIVSWGERKEKANNPSGGRSLSGGSPPFANTIGIVAVAALAARAAALFTIRTATRRPTGSAANAGRRSY
jgi:hypothetical protein